MLRHSPSLIQSPKKMEFQRQNFPIPLDSAHFQDSLDNIQGLDSSSRLLSFDQPLQLPLPPLLIHSPYYVPFVNDFSNQEILPYYYSPPSPNHIDSTSSDTMMPTFTAYPTSSSSEHYPTTLQQYSFPETPQPHWLTSTPFTGENQNPYQHYQNMPRPHDFPRYNTMSNVKPNNVPYPDNEPFPVSSMHGTSNLSSYTNYITGQMRKINDFSICKSNKPIIFPREYIGDTTSLRTEQFNYIDKIFCSSSESVSASLKLKKAVNKYDSINHGFDNTSYQTHQRIQKSGYSNRNPKIYHSKDFEKRGVEDSKRSQGTCSIINTSKVTSNSINSTGQLGLSIFSSCDKPL